MVFLTHSLDSPSIPCYMNVVRIIHLEAGFKSPLKDWDLAMIYKGIQQQLGKPPQQNIDLPITPEILLKIRETLDFSLSKDRVFWRVCMIGFLDFFIENPCYYQNLLLHVVTTCY